MAKEELKNKTKNVKAKKTADKKKVAVKQVKKVEKETKVNTDKGLGKKIVIAVLLVILFLVLFGISESKNDNFKKSDTGEYTEKEQADLNNINVDEYLALKAGSDISVIYIARPTCSHCVNQTPRMKYIKYKYDVEINYLNTDEFDEEGNDYNKLVSSDGYFDEGFGTPTILIVQNDKILDDIAGESEVSTVVDMFKKYNLIKE